MASCESITWSSARERWSRSRTGKYVGMMRQSVCNPDRMDVDGEGGEGTVAAGASGSEGGERVDDGGEQMVSLQMSLAFRPAPSG